MCKKGKKNINNEITETEIVNCDFLFCINKATKKIAPINWFCLNRTSKKGNINKKLFFPFLLIKWISNKNIIHVGHSEYDSKTFDFTEKENMIT